MEAYFLLIGIGHWVVIPEKYPSLDACHNAAKDFSTYTPHHCVPAPKDDYYNCSTAVPDPTNPGRGIAVRSHCEPSVSK